MAETKLRTNSLRNEPFEGHIPTALEGIVRELKLHRIYEDRKCVLFESPIPGRYLKYVVHPATHEPLDHKLQKVVLRGLQRQEQVSDIPGVQKVYGNGFYMGIPGFFELEFVHGTPFDVYTAPICTRRLDPERLYLMGLSAYGTLQSVHERGIIHGDIKPGNIVKPKGAIAVKIIDWSLAKTREEHEEEVREGLLLGTPPYFKPNNDNFPVRDWYGLGHTLLEAATTPRGIEATTEDGYTSIDMVGKRPSFDEMVAQTGEWVAYALDKLKTKGPKELHEMVDFLIHAPEQKLLYQPVNGYGAEEDFARADTIMAPSITRADRPGSRKRHETPAETLRQQTLQY